MALGPRLRQLRELAGLSQNELAKRASIPRPVISDVESGNQRSMNLETARKLARVLGVTLDFLAGPGDDEDDEEAPRRRVAVVA
jgi:transcriptional regulator with XRE-family HTH domain